MQSSHRKARYGGFSNLPSGREYPRSLFGATLAHFLQQFQVFALLFAVGDDAAPFFFVVE